MSGNQVIMRSYGLTGQDLEKHYEEPLFKVAHRGSVQRGELEGQTKRTGEEPELTV